MKIRKWTSLVIAAALVASLATTAMANTVPGAVYGDQQAVGVNKPMAQVAQELQQAGVKDVKADHYAAGSLTVLIQAGLIQPDASGNVKPDAPLSGGEGVAVFAKVLGIASKTDTPEQALAKAKEAGLVGGNVTATQDLPRLEVARLLAKALGVQPKPVFNPAQYPFKDMQGLSMEDNGILAALYELGIFKGFEDKTFRPDAILTRAQIAILIDRILGAK